MKAQLAAIAAPASRMAGCMPSGAATAARMGSSVAVVAVFDAGISQSHPDLAGQLVPGWNFVNDSDDTDDPFTSHGTHCAGIIAATTANREGIASVAWHASLMPVVVLNKYGVRKREHGR